MCIASVVWWIFCCSFYEQWYHRISFISTILVNYQTPETIQLFLNLVGCVALQWWDNQMEKFVALKCKSLLSHVLNKFNHMRTKTKRGSKNQWCHTLFYSVLCDFNTVLNNIGQCSRSDNPHFNLNQHMVARQYSF